ncbi:hypothetical protein FRB96_001284 [Tulasnella sp. 330]|nr:hypothetical protein FRB96_001284 [Tulasnella sp. 330]
MEDAFAKTGGDAVGRVSEKDDTLRIGANRRVEEFCQITPLSREKCGESLYVPPRSIPTSLGSRQKPTPSNTLFILITGSNEYLGYEAALQLSKHAHVHLLISGRDPARVEEAFGKVSKDEGCRAKVQSVIIDVSDDDSIRAAVAEVGRLLVGEPPDVLVVSVLFTTSESHLNDVTFAFANNSGILALATDDIRRTFLETYAANVFGSACTAAAFTPLLKRSKQVGGGES